MIHMRRVVRSRLSGLFSNRFYRINTEIMGEADVVHFTM